MEKTLREAQRRGDEYYFTGAPCKNGHVAKRETSSGRCVMCRDWNRCQQWASTIIARSRRKNISCEVTAEYLLENTPICCPILGIELIPGSSSDASPTVDRIDPTEGYTLDNIQIISRKANTIKSNATAEELRLIYEHLKRLE